VSNTGYLILFCVDVRFVGEMNSVIYMTDGTIRIEKVKIKKQYWVNPLIDVNATASGSGATVEFLSSNITNCAYLYNRIQPYKSGIIFFTNTSTQKLNMTILSSSFLNNLFYLSNNSSAHGSAFHFHRQNSTSGIN
jgi:hypothetical protein